MVSLPSSSFPGALVISLDFELHWGLRDGTDPKSAEVRRLLRARQVVPGLLDVFREFEVSATWATVGFLFAQSRQELESCMPSLRPRYIDPRLFPYEERLGENEQKDPLHFAASLVREIKDTPRQEIATHTFSHYFCGEEGQTREHFRADLEAAVAIATKRGIGLRSIVFPRNQHNPEYDQILIDQGILSYRGNPPSYAWRFTDRAGSRSVGKRVLRLADAYVNISGSLTTSWHEIVQSSGLCNVRASLPLRPYQTSFLAPERLRFERIKACLRHAARNHEVFHLWWHPHNFGLHIEENLRFLRRVLEEFHVLRQSEGMASCTMDQVGEIARQGLKGEMLPPAGKHL